MTNSHEWLLFEYGEGNPSEVLKHLLNHLSDTYTKRTRIVLCKFESQIVSKGFKK